MKVESRQDKPKKGKPETRHATPTHTKSSHPNSGKPSKFQPVQSISAQTRPKLKHENSPHQPIDSFHYQSHKSTTPRAQTRQEKSQVKPSKLSPNQAKTSKSTQDQHSHGVRSVKPRTLTTQRSVRVIYNSTGYRPTRHPRHRVAKRILHSPEIAYIITQHIAQLLEHVTGQPKADLKHSSQRNKYTRYL